MNNNFHSDNISDFNFEHLTICSARIDNDDNSPSVTAFILVHVKSENPLLGLESSFETGKEKSRMTVKCS